jgi:Surfeit locus protein 6/60S ribosome biogenesis protein Rrp14
MPPKVISAEKLFEDLQNDNVFFDELVDMIPAKLYVAGNSGDDFNPKYFKGQAKESKEARRAKSKQAKRAKLDPSLAETTTQAKKRLEGGDGDVAPLPTGFVVSPTPVSPEPEKIEEPLAPTGLSRIEVLRAKLHAKLAEKRGERPADPNAVSKRAARRAEKKKRQEEATKRKKKAHTHADGSNSKTYKVGDSAGADDPTTDLAQLDFGRLAGLNKATSSNYGKANKSLANLGKSKNLQKMLADAEAKQQRLQELKQSQKEEDKQQAAKIEWSDAIKEAAGDRVKDDPTKLKKALKRQVAKKAKSAKAWKSRMDQTQQKIDERQKIRQHNLTKRKQGGAVGANLSKKRIITDEDKAGGRRGGRAGFEGRKQEFLNKKKTFQ